MSIAQSPSEKYLEPEDPERLGDAVLHLYVTESGKEFVIEIYDEVIREDGAIQPQSPASIRAAQFVNRRFKHGFRTINRKNTYHPVYQVPITDYTVALIQNAWTGKKKISDMARPYFRNIFLREHGAEMNAKRTAEFKFNSVVPSDPWFLKHDAMLAERGITLSPYQKCGAYNACKSKSYAFFCDPGLGKTCMMLRKLDYVISNSTRPTMSVVFCPKSVRSNWVNEVKKFSAYSDELHIITLQGNSPTDRLVNFINDMAADEAHKIDGTPKHILLIAGFDSWVNTEKLYKSIEDGGMGFEFDLAMLDESQNIANPGTKRTKTFLESRDCFANVVIATGTPFRNTPFDLYSQLEFLGKGYSGFDSFAGFKAFYGEYGAPNAYNGMSRLTGFQNIPLLQEKMSKHAFVMRKEEALPFLPKKTSSILECNLSHDQLKAYIQLSQQLMAEIESYGPNPDTITVNNILTQMLRLAQITSGFAATDAGTITRFDPNPKMDLLINYLIGGGDDDFPGVLLNKDSKVIIWTVFKENIKMIRSALQLKGITSVQFHGGMSDDEKDFSRDEFNNNRDCRVFVGIQASGGVGLNLVGFDSSKPDEYETNCDNIINYASNWSWVNREQAMNRAHRHNTRVPIHITDLLVPNSIDVEIYERLKMKGQMATTLQDLKRILTAKLPSVNGN